MTAVPGWNSGPDGRGPQAWGQAMSGRKAATVASGMWLSFPREASPFAVRRGSSRGHGAALVLTGQKDSGGKQLTQNQTPFPVRELQHGAAGCRPSNSAPCRSREIHHRPQSPPASSPTPRAVQTAAGWASSTAPAGLSHEPGQAPHAPLIGQVIQLSPS